MEQGRFYGLTCLCFTSVLPQTNQDPQNPLWSMKKNFLSLLVFSCNTEKEKVRQRKQDMLWAFMLHGNPGLCFCLLTAHSRLLYVPPKKGDNVVGFPQSLFLSGGFSLEYCVSGSGRSSGAWWGCGCWPEEMCVRTVTHCFQGPGNKPSRKPEKCFIS